MLAEDYVGRVLKDIYRIDRLLGEGGPSVVFCGWDLLMEIPIAIKRLKKEATGRLIDPQRFLREARTQARLVHQNIVSIRAIIEDQDEYFIIMEYIEGRDLQSLIQRSQTMPRFSFPDALRIFEQVLSALGYAHKEGVIHRDIKPANILVADSLQVKLADFGLARVMQDKRLTEAGVVLGTPAYMAPEQVRSHKVDQRADIYAVGASIYESLSGATPFAHPNRPMSPFEMMRKQLYEDAPSLREKGLAIGDALDAVLRKSIAKDPEQRYASCEALSEALALAMKEDPLWSFVPISPSSSPSSSTQLYASVSPEDAEKRDAVPVLSPVRKRIPLRPPMETAPPKDNDEVLHSAETVSPIEGIPAYLSAQVEARKAESSSAPLSAVATAPASAVATASASSNQEKPHGHPTNTSEKPEPLGEQSADLPSQAPASRPALLPTAIVPVQAKHLSESTGAKAPTPATLPQIELVSEASGLPVGASPIPPFGNEGHAPTVFDLPLPGEASAHPAEMIAIPPEPTDPHLGPSPSSSHLLAPRSSAAALPIAVDDTPPLHHTRRPRKRRSSVPWGLVLLALLLIAMGAAALGWGRIKNAWVRLSVKVQQKIEPLKKASPDTAQATTYPQEKVPDMIMVEIPEGPFWRGFGSRNDVFSYAPRERITLRRYWIDRNEVSVLQYDRCVKAGGLSPCPHRTRATRNAAHKGHLGRSAAVLCLGRKAPSDRGGVGKSCTRDRRAAFSLGRRSVGLSATQLPPLSPWFVVERTCATKRWKKPIQSL